jgi:hypothetical protein
MPTTTFIVRDDRGDAALVLDAERAERLSRAGLRVTAVTEGQR